MMRVLLTGASGFVGRHVLSKLVESGVDVCVIGRSVPPEFKGDFIAVDLLQLNDFKDVTERTGATYLVHLAWYGEFRQYWASTLNLRWVEASVRLVESFCAAGGQKVVIAGTCAEYDWSTGFCREDTTPLIPASLYGTSKDATRRLLEAVCKLNETKFAWGRIFLPYGKGEDTRRLIPSLIDVFGGGRAPFGVNANVFRDFLNVEDVASALICLLNSDAEGCYNIASSNPIQIADVVRRIAHRFNADPRLILNVSTERPNEPVILFGDNRKLKSHGWYPTHSIDEIAQC